MPIVILRNPNAGSGRGERLARRIDEALRAAGHATRLISTAANGALGPALEDASALVCVGGDGTIHHALPALLERDVPVYHAAAGKENLFAREFGMRAQPKRVVAAIERGATRRMDIALCAASPFALMLSVGPDASILHAVEGGRSGPVSRLDFLWPIVREALRPGTVPLTIDVDGQRLVEGARGVAIVANSGRYALGIDPAESASIDDGLLDVIFLPFTSGARLAGWMLSARTRWLRRSRVARRAQGRRIALETAAPTRTQMDGEVSSLLGAPEALRLEIEAKPAALRALLP